MPISIKVAENAREKQKVYELRYKVYIEEMKRTSKYLDGEKKELKDPYDENAYILYAEDDGEVVGSLRLHINQHIPFEYINFYKMQDLIAKFPKQTSITTKFVVKESYRKTTVASRLAFAAYEYGETMSILFNVIDTNPYLLRFYQKMGYRMYMDNIYHPEYGNVIPMMLFKDRDYLKSIKSPFRFLDGDVSTNEGIEFFRKYYEKYSEIKPLFSLSQDEIWDFVTNEINVNPNQGLRFLCDFNEEESKYILKYFDAVNYKKHTILSQKKYKAKEFYCILKGKVKIKVFDKQNNSYSYYLTAGDCFGGPAFLSDKFNKLIAEFQEDTQLLLLNDDQLNRLQKRNEMLSERFMINIQEHSKRAVKVI